MVVVFGTRLYGSCDQIKGIGHIETQFFHIDFVPLVPVGSYFVWRSRGDIEHDFCLCPGRIRTITSLNGIWCKSVLIAYVRGILTATAFILFLIAIITADDYNSRSSDIYLLFFGAFGSIMGAYLVGEYGRRRNVSYDRAQAIAMKLGSARLMTIVDTIYGRIPQQDEQQQQRQQGAIEEGEDPANLSELPVAIQVADDQLTLQENVPNAVAVEITPVAASSGANEKNKLSHDDHNQSEMEDRLV